MKLNLPEKEICDKYLSGMSGPKLAKEYGVSNDIIYGLLERQKTQIRTMNEAIKLSRKDDPSLIENLKLILSLNLPEEKIGKEYMLGKSMSDLATIYKCSDGSIANILRRQNIKIRSSVDAQLLAQGLNLPEMEICEKYKSGLSTHKLAEIYNCSSPAIGDILRRNRVKLRTNSESVILARGLDLPEEEICEEYKLGKSMHDLEEEYGCCNGTVEKILERNNIKRRVPKESSVLVFENNPTLAERMSATHQGQDYDAGKWTGFVGDGRDYVLPEEECIKINKRFPNSHFHHLTKSLGIYVPEELHRHYYPHDIRTGLNMGEINMAALQFDNGGL